MNKQDIIKKLANPRLDDYERESLSQLLHYMNAEGVNNTSSNNTIQITHTSVRVRTSSNYKGNKHTSSNKHTR